MQLVVGCIIFLIILGHHVINNYSNVKCTYPSRGQHDANHNHKARTHNMPLLGNQKLDEYMVVLEDGQERWTEYVMAPDLEHAAWAGFELSTN
jgi:hypothetical protein